MFGLRGGVAAGELTILLRTFHLHLVMNSKVWLNVSWWHLILVCKLWKWMCLTISYELENSNPQSGKHVQERSRFMPHLRFPHMDGQLPHKVLHPSSCLTTVIPLTLKMKSLILIEALSLQGFWSSATMSRDNFLGRLLSTNCCIFIVWKTSVFLLEPQNWEGCLHLPQLSLTFWK